MTITGAVSGSLLALAAFGRAGFFTTTSVSLGILRLFFFTPRPFEVPGAETLPEPDSDFVVVFFEVSNLPSDSRVA